MILASKTGNHAQPSVKLDQGLNRSFSVFVNVPASNQI